jgi:hypothetical protein
VVKNLIMVPHTVYNNIVLDGCPDDLLRSEKLKCLGHRDLLLYLGMNTPAQARQGIPPINQLKKENVPLLNNVFELTEDLQAVRSLYNEYYSNTRSSLTAPPAKIVLIGVDTLGFVFYKDTPFDREGVLELAELVIPAYGMTTFKQLNQGYFLQQLIKCA